jgi:glycosyltransferase involved in cell wall biosynthesis
MNSPSISVLVIAHNEELHIGKCLDSLLVQTKHPDEIVVVAHNCTDRTEEIVSHYSDVKLVSYTGPVGQIHARIEGFKQARGEIIICTDGDAIVDKDWVENMSAPLTNPAITGVGGLVVSRNVWLGKTLSPFLNFYLPQITRYVHGRARYLSFWGASFALRKADYVRIGGLAQLLSIKKSIFLTETPDDFYLAVMLGKLGKIVTVTSTKVFVFSKEETSAHTIERSRHQVTDGKKLYEYLRKISIL